jgi:branched-subunit amino acid transport protein
MDDTLLIAGMIAVTFLSRYLPFFLAGRLRLPLSIEQALNYVPIAVLTIIVVQVSLYQQGQLTLTWNNPYIGASVAAFVAALVQKRLLVTISIGMISYAALRYFL